MQFNIRCSICVHPDRAAIINDRLNRRLSAEKIAETYFPGRGKIAAARAIRNHFKRHQDPDEEARIAVTTAIVAQAAGAGITMSDQEERVFTAAVRQRMQSALAIEQMLQALAQRANDLDGEYKAAKAWAVQGGKRCDKCGRGMELQDFLQEEKNLTRTIAVFREIREQISQLLDIKNPASVVEKMAEKTFVLFVREMTDLYMQVMIEKAGMAFAAIDRFFAGQSDEPTLRADMGAMREYGLARVAAEADTAFQRIMNTMLKELRQ